MKKVYAFAMVMLLLASCKEDKAAKDVVKDAPTTEADLPQQVRSSLPAPFDTMDFDRAVAYDYEGGYDGVAIIGKDGRPDASIQKQKELTDKEAADFLGVLGNPGTYGGYMPDCFDPHLGLVLYKGDAVVFHASICLACRQLKSSVAIPAMDMPHKDPKTGRDIFDTGFSDEGMQSLMAFCSAFKFSHCSEMP